MEEYFKLPFWLSVQAGNGGQIARATGGFWRGRRTARCRPYRRVLAGNARGVEDAAPYGGYADGNAGRPMTAPTAIAYPVNSQLSIVTCHLSIVDCHLRPPPKPPWPPGPPIPPPMPPPNWLLISVVSLPLTMMVPPVWVSVPS